MKRFATLFVAFALVAASGCKSVNVPAVSKTCCGAADCGCDRGECCNACKAEVLPTPRVLPPSSEAAH